MDSIAIPDTPQIAIALRLIHEHPERSWSVAKLARETGMLCTGRRPIPEIYQLSGYGSDAAVARAFKWEFGASPDRFERAAHCWAAV